MKLLERIAQYLPLAWRTDEQILRHRPIPERLWQQTLAQYPFLAWRHQDALARLRRLTTLFLARKEFVPAGGLHLTDDMAVAIAAQACLPAISLGLQAYDHVHSIVVHPDQVVAQREVMDEAGVVHRYEEVLSGEAMPGGPVMLSWHDVRQSSDDLEAGYNVVIHEFAHALDMRKGDPDGVPPLPPGLSRQHWQEVLWRAFDQHSEALAHGDETWLDPYATTSGLVEFFPVVTEAFFVAPRALRADFPSLYALLSRCFHDDPADHAPARGPNATHQ